MIVKAEEVRAFTLRQHVTAGPPTVSQEVIVSFLTGDDEEIGQIVKLYRNGRSDPRIVETAVPDHVWDMPNLNVEFISMTCPDGNDVMHHFFPEVCGEQ